MTLLLVKYEILKKHSILVYVKKPAGFFFRRITTDGRDSPPLRKADDTPISGACVHKRMPKLAVDGCCEAAAYGIRPWTLWIWGTLNFRPLGLKESGKIRIQILG
jgi:hypothetical protein